MSKIYIAKIEVEYEVDENNNLHWEEDFEPRTKEKLVDLLKNELDQIIFSGVQSNQIYDMITVEEKGN
jgi:hypothetical protein